MPPEYHVYVPENSRELFEAVTRLIPGVEIEKLPVQYEDLAARIRDVLSKYPDHVTVGDLMAYHWSKEINIRSGSKSPEGWLAFIESLTGGEKQSLTWACTLATRMLGGKNVNLGGLRVHDWSKSAKYSRAGRLLKAIFN